MTTHINGTGYQIQATEDLTLAKLKIITLTGLIAQAQSRLVAGICTSNPTSGYNATAIVQGIAKAFVGAAVGTVGYPLKVANSGFLVVAASGDLTCGRALATAASGDLAPVFIDCLNLGYNYTA